MADTPVAAAVEAVRQPDIKQAEDTATAPAAPAVDPKMDAFARKERQIRKMQQELAQERTAMTAKQKEYETNYVPRSRLSEDPLSVLQENGVSYDKLTELLLAQPNQNDPTIRALRAEIKALADKQTQSEKATQDAQSQQYEQAKKQIGMEAKMLVDSDPEYETIKATGMHDAVVELIVETFNREGHLMDIAEAAKEIENHLVEEYSKGAQYSKVQARLKPKTEQPESAPGTKTVTFKQSQPKVVPREPELKTLTNRVTQETSKGSSAKEKRERAIAAFYGKLNQ